MIIFIEEKKNITLKGNKHMEIISEKKDLDITPNNYYNDQSLFIITIPIISPNANYNN